MIRRSIRQPFRIRVKGCYFCENKTEPNYRETGILTNFLTERGKINSRSRTGVCSKHQRHLSKAVKRARIIGLLPFVVRA